jgi:hypothetical protein
MQPQLSGAQPWRRSYRTQSVVAPAAGADWAWTIPAGEYWELVSVYAKLVTSAAVANRFPSLIVGDGVVTFARSAATGSQVASLTGFQLWVPGVTPASQNNINRGPLPTTYLGEGESIGSQTDNIDVGDQWSAIYLRAIVTTWKSGPVNLNDLVSVPVVIVNPTE